jgi:hypothetical protein
MKKAKELGKKNEGRNLKTVMTKDKAAKIITNEINSREKLNQADLIFKKADSYLKRKKKKEDFIEKINNYSRNQSEIIFKKIVGYKMMLIILIV